MASNNLMVGLEIGTSKICVVVGEGRPDGTIKILGVGQAPSRGVRKGEIVDFETAMKCRGRAYFQRDSPPRTGKLTRRDTMSGAADNSAAVVWERASCACVRSA